MQFAVGGFTLCFEVFERDLMGRVGVIETKSGKITTPVLLPVINPLKQTIPPKEIETKFKCEAIITNAYILRKYLRDEAVAQGLHKLLNFSKVIMTDSGAYQLLVYGEVDVSPRDIVEFQEKIGSDIAVILDVPTGGKSSYEHAKKTVRETIKRAEELFNIRCREDLLWVGPIQGGVFPDLVKECALKIGSMPFNIHAIGSPTQLMEGYRFDKLVELICTAKRFLPANRPVHLFGAGHPMMFSLAVALGCDVFDSAAYALYAKEMRYMTPYGTLKIEELKENVCNCPICNNLDVDELRELPKEKKIELIARHNLYVSLNEINTIRQAIKAGRLWEYLEIKTRSHPQLFRAFLLLKKYRRLLEKGTPIRKNHALFYLGKTSLNRPEVWRHLNKLKHYGESNFADILIILPEPSVKPFSKSKEHKKVIKLLLDSGTDFSKVQLMTVSMFFGLVPWEIDEVYPLAQHEVPYLEDYENYNLVANAFKNYVSNKKFSKIILLNDWEKYGEKLSKRFKKIAERLHLNLRIIPEKGISPYSKESLENLRKLCKRNLFEIRRFSRSDKN